MTESITQQQLTDILTENQADLFGSTLNNTGTINDIVTLYTASTSKDNFNELLQSTTIISSLNREMGYIHLVLLLFNMSGTKKYNIIEESLLGGRKNKRKKRHIKKSKKVSKNKRAKLSRKSRKVKIRF